MSGSSVRYVFIGAGAVGSALGGLLALAGRQVVLVARGEHGEALRHQGLTLRCPDLTETLPMVTADSPGQASLTTDDVLVLTTKTQQAEAAIAQWADVDVHRPDGSVAGRAWDLLPILTASNGVAGEEMALRRFRRVFAVCVWFPTIMIDPGEVIIRGAPLRGVFHIGRYGGPAEAASDRRLLEGIEADWGAAGLLVRAPQAVMAWKHRKLLANLGNVLEALLGDAPGAHDLRAVAEAEGRDVLTAAGIAFTGDEEAELGWHPEGLVFRTVPGQPPRLGGSTWQSLVRGSPNAETDFLNGEIALIARRIGISAPVNSGLAALMRGAIRSGAGPGSVTVDEVHAELRTLREEPDDD